MEGCTVGRASLNCCKGKKDKCGNAPTWRRRAGASLGSASAEAGVLGPFDASRSSQPVRLLRAFLRPPYRHCIIKGVTTTLLQLAHCARCTGALSLYSTTGQVYEAQVYARQHKPCC